MRVYRSDGGLIVASKFGVTPVTQAFSDAAAEGSNNASARADHKHGMPATPSSGIAATLVDAKGDIIAATAADTVDRVAVGSNRKFLAADSAAAAGVSWQYPSPGVIKPSDQSKSNTTLADDTALQFPVVSGESWIWLCDVKYVGAAGSLKIGFTGPTGVGMWCFEGDGISNLVWQGDGLPYGDANVQAVVENMTVVRFSGSIIATSTASIKCRWAQNTANGTTIVQAGSWILPTRIG